MGTTRTKLLKEDESKQLLVFGYIRQEFVIFRVENPTNEQYKIFQNWIDPMTELILQYHGSVESYFYLLLCV